jgi:PAS domain S-box-containing protein
MKPAASGAPPSQSSRMVTADSADRHIVEMEGRYRGLLEAAPDAMIVVNEAGKIVLLNLQAEKQFGYSRDELLGQRVTNVIPEGFAERLVAAGRRSAEDALARQIGMGIELTALRKDGSEFPIELMLSPMASPDGVLVPRRSGTSACEGRPIDIWRRWRAGIEACSRRRRTRWWW